MNRTPAEWAEILTKGDFLAHGMTMEACIQSAEPLFAQAMAQAREEALEEAAKECRRIAKLYAYTRACGECAEAILALKSAQCDKP